MELLFFAFGAGVLATVNPCGFAMLPAFFGYYLGHTDEPDAVGVGEAGEATNAGDRPASGGGLLARLAHGAWVGLAVSAGFAGTFVVVAAVIAAGLRQLAGAVPWAAVVIGGVLVVLGGLLLAGRQLSPKLGAGPRRSGGRAWPRMVAFGAGYAVASLSCTLGVLLSVIAQASAAGSMAGTLAVLAAYAAGAAVVVTGVALASALAKAGLAVLMRRLMPVLARASGLLLIVSGGYLIAYWLPALGGEGPSASLGALAETLSGGLSELLSAHLPAVGGVAVLLAVAVAVLLLRRRHRAAGPLAAATLPSGPSSGSSSGSSSGTDDCC
nr:cytochrome c biogenesis protein CcdA [Nonomuraea sp. SBT364]